MKSAHTDIYHCQQCGRVVFQNHRLRPPQCCGSEMTRAVSDVEVERNREEYASHAEPGVDSEANQAGRRSQG